MQSDRAILRTSRFELQTSNLSRILIVLGVLLIAAGLAIKAGLPLGRLPGDIVVHRGSSTFYFPIVTCLVVSVLLSLVAALFRR